MPVRGEDDELDAKKLFQNFSNGGQAPAVERGLVYLWYRPEWCKVPGHAHPKHSKGVQTDSNRDVVNDSTPKVPTFQADVAFLISVGSLHNDRSQGQRRLQPSILQDTSFYCEERVRITDVHLRKYVVHWPDMIFRRTPMHHDDQGTLATEEVDKKLEESVDGESFVHVADRLDELCRRQGHERYP